MIKKNKVVIIAEIGSVHDGSVGQAKNLIREAASCGADAVKIQTHIAEEETLINAPSPKYFNSENNFFKMHRDEISYPKLQFITLEKGDVINSINTYIDDHHADLLVMAKHNRHFFDRLFHRSLSKKMAFHTHITLLILVKENQND
jgi:sialic acid synthase SpsE